MADTISALKITVIFAIGDSYAQHCCTAIASIINNNKDCAFDFFILTDCFSDINKRKFTQTVTRAKIKCTLNFIYVNNDLFKDFKLNINYISHHTYYRLAIPDLLPDVDKALYLDSDLIVTGSLKELWQTNLNDKFLIAGVADGYINRIGHKKAIGLSQDDAYVNAGVLLMNLALMRKQSISKALIRSVRMITSNQIYKFQDQDVINIIMRGKIKLLPPIYNYTSEEANQSEINHIATIIHYTGEAKPWEIMKKCRSPLKKYYFHYLRKTPYKWYIIRFIYGRIIRAIKKHLLGNKYI